MIFEVLLDHSAQIYRHLGHAGMKSRNQTGVERQQIQSEGRNTRWNHEPRHTEGNVAKATILPGPVHDEQGPDKLLTIWLRVEIHAELDSRLRDKT